MKMCVCGTLVVGVALGVVGCGAGEDAQSAEDSADSAVGWQPLQEAGCGRSVTDAAKADDAREEDGAEVGHDATEIGADAKEIGGDAAEVGDGAGDGDAEADGGESGDATDAHDGREVGAAQ